MEKVKGERNGNAMGGGKSLETRAEMERKEDAPKIELSRRMMNGVGWNVRYEWRLAVLKRIVR
jgi:hypothetical protein